MTAPQTSTPTRTTILVWTETDRRAPVLRAQASMAFPRGSISLADTAALAEGVLPQVDAVVIDAEAVAHGAIEVLRLLRARGFLGPIVVVSVAPDDAMLETAVQSLGAVSLARGAVDKTPLELASAMNHASSENTAISAETAYARRVFAAGQMTLSLQHSINNPLAALLAETQLLQLEELTEEQRGSVDRMLELCRRIVALVRRLEALGTAD